MDTQTKLRELVNKLFLNTGAVFSGIFIDKQPIISKTTYSEKKEKLEETLKLIINKAHQINEFINDFGEEYVYAEGSDVSIFIYFVRPDVAVASIIEEKPKFALLKLEHTTVAKKIKGMEDEIDKLIKGEISIEEVEKEKTEEVALESLEEVVPELKKEEKELVIKDQEEKLEIRVEDIKDRYTEELQQLEKVEDIEELEKVLSESQEPSLEEILKPPEEIEEVEEKIESSTEKTGELEEKQKEEKQPVIEEPIEEELYQPEVLEQIQKELLKEIGPVGKFIFKKRKKELGIQEDHLTRTDIIRLIEKLSDDIIDERRKNRFLEKVSAFI